MAHPSDYPIRERDTQGKAAICAVAGGVVVEATRCQEPVAPQKKSLLLAWITHFFRRDTDDSHPIDRATD